MEGVKKRKKPEMETGEEAGRDVHLTGGWGGSSTGFVLLQCSCCCSAQSPPLLPCFPVSSFPPFSVFFPLLSSARPDNMLYSEHMIRQSGEMGGALPAAGGRVNTVFRRDVYDCFIFQKICIMADYFFILQHMTPLFSSARSGSQPAAVMSTIFSKYPVV